MLDITMNAGDCGIDQLQRVIVCATDGDFIFVERLSKEFFAFVHENKL